MRTLAIIPARGGSVGLPKKNLARIGNRNLVEWAIYQAQQTDRQMPIVVSTDDHEIAYVGGHAGAMIRHRPVALAHDATPMAEVLADTLDWAEIVGPLFDAVVCLQPTCPLRMACDIRACLEILERIGVDSVASRVRVWDCHPGRMQWENGDPVYSPSLENQRRQDLPACYVRNGAIYAARSSVIRDGHIYGSSHHWYEMPRWRSINIDDELDLVCCRAVYDEYHR